MNRTSFTALAFSAGAGLLATLGSTCSSTVNPPATALDHAYLGHLDLLYEQDLPEISASARMEVTVDRNGTMTFQPGTLSYDGESTIEDSRLRRSGTVNLAPTGSWFDNNGVDQFAVDENGSGQDRLQQWLFDGVTWQLFLDETTPIDWNGGLTFRLDDAVWNGSVLAVNAGLFRVRWTLYLTPALE